MKVKAGNKTRNNMSSPNKNSNFRFWWFNNIIGCSLISLTILFKPLSEINSGKFVVLCFILFLIPKGLSDIVQAVNNKHIVKGYLWIIFVGFMDLFAFLFFIFIYMSEGRVEDYVFYLIFLLILLQIVYILCIIYNIVNNKLQGKAWIVFLSSLYIIFIVLIFLTNLLIGDNSRPETFTKVFLTIIFTFLLFITYGILRISIGDCLKNLRCLPVVDK